MIYAGMAEKRGQLSFQSSQSRVQKAIHVIFTRVKINPLAESLAWVVLPSCEIIMDL